MSYCEIELLEKLVDRSSKVQRITLSHNGLVFNRDDATRFSDLLIKTKITSLNLSHNKIRSDEFVFILEKLSRLETLDLSYNKMVIWKDQFFVLLNALSRLKKLNLSGNNIYRLVASSEMLPPNLEELSIEFCDLSRINDITTLIHRNSNLKSLNIKENGFFVDLDFLDAVIASNLTKLQISRNSITLKHLKYLASAFYSLPRSFIVELEVRTEGFLAKYEMNVLLSFIEKIRNHKFNVKLVPYSPREFVEPLSMGDMFASFRTLFFQN
ncbi:hypothetical protein O9G_002343 [Rozella allomycis CSF55]|uniref:RNI-like protein n=1 Tax=Rozella allomycis (strain CSF55) TaxID=988480 RepID=A0A075B2F8_ROZAC|nr:hypothetical protein O9G_002343 [Rozella allomycis CSF55]|eukprot:EPZ36732.1 hypothetical protein O9G_002343 [Rozella allomycis CSF55]